MLSSHHLCMASCHRSATNIKRAMGLLPASFWQMSTRRLFEHFYHSMQRQVETDRFTTSVPFHSSRADNTLNNILALSLQFDLFSFPFKENNSFFLLEGLLKFQQCIVCQNY